MYVFYEHHKDANGVITMTDLRLSSRKAEFRIDFFQPREKALFELSKTILKECPTALRSYEPNTFTWSYLGADWGNLTIAKLKLVSKAIHEIEAIEVEDLAGYSAMGGYKPEARAKRPKADEFFYTHEPVSTPAMSKETAKVQLINLLTTVGLIVSDVDKKAYRQAALRLHPDRNNGDGSKMSELNMLWGIYNG